MRNQATIGVSAMRPAQRMGTVALILKLPVRNWQAKWPPMIPKFLWLAVLLAVVILFNGCALQTSPPPGEVAGKNEVFSVEEQEQIFPTEQRVDDPTERILNPSLSCIGHCTGYAESGNEWCFCDAVCEQNGNCCSDFKTACRLPLRSESTPDPNAPLPPQLIPPDPTGLSRQYPYFMKCAAINSPELPELVRHIEELQALGHNTICIGQSIDQFNPRIDVQESAAMQSRTLSAIVTFKKAGFAISLDIDTGGPMAENEIAKLTSEQFLTIIEEEVLKWAALAEEYQVEYFTPVSEMPSKLHNLYPESERQQKKVERANRWYHEVLPKVREVFRGKVVARLGAYYSELRPRGYDMVAYTTGHGFITNLDKFRQEVQKVYFASRELANANQTAWWVTTYFAYDEGFNPNAPIEYTTLRTSLQDLQDDYYRIAIEEIEALLPEQRPTGFEGGHMPVSPTTKTTDEAKGVVQDFFRG